MRHSAALRYLASGADDSSIYMKVVRVEGRDVVCQAQNDSELSGLLTVLHDSSGQASTGGGLNLTDLPLLSQSDVAALKCAERLLPLPLPLLPSLLLLLLLVLVVAVVVVVVVKLLLLLADGRVSQPHRRFRNPASGYGLVRCLDLSAVSETNR